VTVGGERRRRPWLAAAGAAGVALAVSVPLLAAARAPAPRLALEVGATPATSTTPAARVAAEPATTTSVTTSAPAGQDGAPAAGAGRSPAPSGHEHDEPAPGPSPQATPPSTAGGEPSTTVPAPALTMEVSHDEPVRSGDTVTWTLTVTNNGGPTTLVFRSGKSGEVSLISDAGDVAYDSDRDMVWASMMREEPLAAGATATYTVTGLPLDVEPGQYRLVADLASEPAPPTVTGTVTVAP
jgi:hypothetical protein